MSTKRKIFGRILATHLVNKERSAAVSAGPAAAAQNNQDFYSLLRLALRAQPRSIIYELACRTVLINAAARTASVVILSFILTSSLLAGEQQRSPFGIQVVPKPDSSSHTVEVKFTIPSDCFLYSERLHFLTGDDDDVAPSKIPEPLTEMDKVSGKQKKVYEKNFNVELPMASLADNRLMVKFQGCSNGSCFFPEKRTFVLNTNPASAKMFTEIMPAATPSIPSPADSDWAKQLNGFKVAARQSGYLPTKKFLSFLERAQSGNDSVDDP
ncbi:MAG TPA: protein-disulfide reductase DsbD N-terminal domain-containing protein, partial [Verrucomicrobiae bacterium]|nr:protein-disulfide reductase DsbD N-terminal domain-containing protein [Verrucomicrobiae bacterium]